ncbi:MAG: thioredoxin domain-containing protein [Candidatus Paceibacterota bacterium]
MENHKKEKINTPTAIIVAGFLIMLAILITRSSGQNGENGATNKGKTLSEQVGISKTKFAECVKNTDTTALNSKIQESMAAATKGGEGVGTPYSIILGANGVKSQVTGADSYENVKKVIDEVNSGKVTTPYIGEVPPVDDTDHVKGDPKTAQITIIEYSDFECPFCARFHPVLERIVSESNGSIAWVYRQFPLTQIHKNAMDRAIASECVAKLKGNDAFWKYADLLFGLLTPTPAPAANNL